MILEVDKLAMVSHSNNVKVKNYHKKPRINHSLDY